MQIIVSKVITDSRVLYCNNIIQCVYDRVNYLFLSMLSKGSIIWTYIHITNVSVSVCYSETISVKKTNFLSINYLLLQMTSVNGNQ